MQREIIQKSGEATARSSRYINDPVHDCYRHRFYECYFTTDTLTTTYTYNNVHAPAVSRISSHLSDLIIINYTVSRGVGKHDIRRHQSMHRVDRYNFVTILRAFFPSFFQQLCSSLPARGFIDLSKNALLPRISNVHPIDRRFIDLSDETLSFTRAPMKYHSIAWYNKNSYKIW